MAVDCELQDRAHTSLVSRATVVLGPRLLLAALELPALELRALELPAGPRGRVRH